VRALFKTLPKKSGDFGRRNLLRVTADIRPRTLMQIEIQYPATRSIALLLGTWRSLFGGTGA
jgi:hypothetical protein